MKNATQISTTTSYIHPDQLCSIPYEVQFFVNLNYQYTINLSKTTINATIRELARQYPGQLITHGKAH